MPQNFPMLMTDDLKLAATKKLIFDGDGDLDTYWVESSEDQADLVVGGVTVIEATATVVTIPVLLAVTGESTFSSNVVLARTGADIQSVWLQHAGTGQMEIRMARAAGTVTDWILYCPSGSTDFRLYQGADRFTFGATGNLGVTGNVGIGQAASGSVPLAVAESAANRVANFLNSHATTPDGIQVQFSGGAPNDQTQYFLKCLDDGATRFRVWSDGSILSDLLTADTKHIELQSTGPVDHGMTDFANTGTYGFFQKETAAEGGIEIWGMSEADVAIRLRGYGTSDNTTKTVSGRAYIETVAGKKNGTGIGDPGANANIFAVGAAVGGTKFIVDAEGELFADGGVGSTNMVTLYDEFDDVALLRTLDIARNRRGAMGMVRQAHDDLIQYNEATLVELGLLGDTLANGGLLNVTGFQRLQTGAIIQNRALIRDNGLAVHGAMERIEVLETIPDEVTALRKRVKTLENQQAA